MSRFLATLPNRKFSVEDYHRFIEMGVFEPEERLELWEGEFVEMSPIGKRHAGCVDALSEIIREFVGRNAIVRTQNPIVLNDFSEPQPDIALLRRREDYYRSVSATAADVLLTIEVADTTVKYDRNVKFPKYAASGIPEAWLVDLENDRVEIHSQPSESGYAVVKILQRGEIVESTVLKEIRIPVKDILGES
jgi:Uma2 family endonuclease